jgi:hypothetical protein
MRNIVTRFFQLPERLLIFASIAIGFLSLLALPATALAATPTATPTTTPPKQMCAATDVNCVIQFGNQQISNRLAALNKLNTAVSNDQKKHLIDDAQADLIQADITTNINGLNALKVTLDAEKDAKAARQDVEKIVVQFRIFAVVLPRDYKRLHLDIEITVEVVLKGLEAPVGDLINHSSADKADLNKLFSDFKYQVTDAENKINLAQQILPLLTVANFNNDHATYITNLKNLTTDEQIAHTDLHKAAADLHQITQNLKLV